MEINLVPNGVFYFDSKFKNDKRLDEERIKDINNMLANNMELFGNVTL